MTEPVGRPRSRDRALFAVLSFGALSVLLLAATQLFLGLRQRSAGLPVPPVASSDGGASAATPSAWASVPAASALASAVDVAFAAGGTLSTDGKLATYDPGDGTPRPLEVPAAIARVFAAAGKLFAAGENEGAPFLILLAPRDEALVVPAPCALSRLAGDGLVLAGSCAEGPLLAVSADGGKSFNPVPLEPPAPKEVVDTEILKSVEAVAVSPAGVVAVAVSQRWQSDRPGGALSWSWGQVAVRSGPGKPFRFSSVHALTHAVGLSVAGGVLTLAGLEVALDGSSEGETHARLWRGGEGEAPVPVGEMGPACGTVEKARAVDGVLLGDKVAVLRCGEGLAVTLDGGASWKLERALGAVQVLRGGDMRLFARAGDKAFERRFVNRSDSGATAVHIPGLTLVRRDAGEVVDAMAPPLPSPFGIREPELDAGLDAGGGIDAAP